MQAARRDCERGIELWFNTKSEGWEWDAIFVVPWSPAESGWFMASDSSPPDQPGFDWLRSVSTSPQELVGLPSGEEFSFNGNVVDLGESYKLVLPGTEIVLQKSDWRPEEGPEEKDYGEPARDHPFLASLHIIILPSGKSRSLRRYAGGDPQPSGDFLVYWAKTKMVFHSNGSVTTLEEETENFTGDDARAFMQYIKLIGQTVPIEFP